MIGRIPHVVHLGHVRVLSVHQPWAELILRGIKTIENRSWTTPHRGWTILHAGLKVDAVGDAWAIRNGIPIERRDLAAGYIGLVDLADIHPAARCCAAVGGAPEGQHWQLWSPHRFPEPIEARGRLGAYTLPYADYPTITAALEGIGFRVETP